MLTTSTFCEHTTVVSSDTSSQMLYVVTGSEIFLQDTATTNKEHTMIAILIMDIILFFIQDFMSDTLGI